MSNPKVVFVLGGPGSGKGTLCSIISKKYEYIHISAGDCLREEMENPDSKYGESIRKKIAEGSIVPVEITVSLLRQKMINNGWENGKFLIDGYPRNLNNLDGWVSTMKDVDVQGFINLKCSDETMIQRILNRSQIENRTDDNMETLKKRLIVFKESTQPIIDYLGQRYEQLAIDTEKSIEEIVKENINSMNSFFSS